MRFNLSVVAAFLISASSLQAAVSFELPGWTRPASAAQASDTLTTYQHWDTFRSQTSNAPDKGLINPNGVPTAFDANFPASSSIVTSTGNLYAGSGIIRMNAVVPGFGRSDAVATRFLVQIATTANALFDEDGLWTAATPANPTENDFSRLLVNGQRVDSLPSFAHERLFFLQGSSPTSFNFERAITFELPGNASSYTVEWTAPRGSTGMAEIAIDTVTIIPEPGALSLLGAAGLLALRRRRAATPRV